eukprot:TRINITY_DN6671_c0_g1_i1.p1 TRINITY_DN6671_c0_g1~~TRINITY_DN6671_c0_g1_i1.p1  ORF type:complete len:357 (-),score=78.38 TRINITY_DN6671_c0_g1_i1:589-1506(-)
MSEPSTITTMNGLSLPLKMSVNYISFSARSDFLQTSEFIDTLLPPNVVLVHGDANEMGRLKQSLVQKYENKNIHIYSPKNGQPVQLEFRAEKLAKTVGQLALKSPEDGRVISGVIVVKDFNNTIMDPTELSTFTQLTTSTLLQHIIIPFPQKFSIIVENVSQIYSVEDFVNSSNNHGIKICDQITLIQSNDQELVMEWTSDPVNDMIADSVLAILSQIQVMPVSAKPKKERTIEYVYKHLKEQFVDVKLDEVQKLITITGNSTCVVNYESKQVYCQDPLLRQQVESFIRRLDFVVNPLSSKNRSE